MKTRRQLFLLVLVFSGTLQAHDNWLYTDSSSFIPGDSVEVHIRSGHLGGESEFLMANKMIQEAFLVSPGGHQEALIFFVKNQEQTCSFLAQETGIYTVFVNLRKRPKGPFSYLLKTTIRVGNSHQQESPAPNQQLEIVFADSPTSLMVKSAGAVVKVPVALMLPGREPRSLSMDRNGISTFTPEDPGVYIAICHFRRQTASYSFYMNN